MSRVSYSDQKKRVTEIQAETADVFPLDDLEVWERCDVT